MERQKDLDNEIEIDLKDLMLEVLAYWKIIVLMALLTGAIAFAVSKYLMVPKYESTAELCILTKTNSITSLADIQIGTSLTNDYIVVVKERPVLDQVIDNLGLSDNYNSLKNRVVVNNPTNSRLLQITVTDTDPNRAKAIADEIAAVASDFIQEKMAQTKPTTTQHGYADGAPISPNVTKNTLLGAIAGGFVTLAIVIITYLFNDTISGPEDIEKKLGMNVLGTLPLEEVEDDGEKPVKSSNKKRKKKKRS